MKYAFFSIASLFLLGTSAFAQANERTSDATITPTLPAFCEKSNYLSVNRISAPVTQEDASTLTVEFKTDVGSCTADHFTAEPLEGASVKIIGDAFYGFFSAYPANAALEIKTADSEQGLVRLVFDKNRIFKDTSTADFLYSLVTFSGVGFRWNIQLTLLPSGKTLLQFMHK